MKNESRRWIYLLIMAILLLSVAVIGRRYFFAKMENKSTAKVIILSSRGVEFLVASQADTLKDLLKEQNLPEGQAYIAPDPEGKLFSGLKVIYRAPVRVDVIDGGKSRQVATSAGTVEEMLVENQINLNPKDQLSVSPDSLVYQGMRLVINRVEEAEEVKIEPIAFAVTEVGDPALLYGKSRVLTNGRDGRREVSYLVRYRDGTEIYRKKLSTKILENPVAEIRQVGRKIEVEAYEQGRASWYDYRKCLCAAHPFFPKGSVLRVTNSANQKSVIVTVNDSGPDQSIHAERLIDLDAVAFKLLAPLSVGTIEVKVEKIKSE